MSKRSDYRLYSLHAIRHHFAPSIEERALTRTEMVSEKGEDLQPAV